MTTTTHLTSRLLPVWLALLIGCAGDTGRSSLVSPAGPSGIGTRTSLVTGNGTSNCVTDLQGAPETVAGTGGRFTLVITAPSDCAWTVTGVSGVVPDADSGRGPARVGIAVEPNPDLDRTLSVNVSGYIFHFRQPQGCYFEPTPENLMVNADGGSATVRIESLRGCLWFASASEDWIDVPEERGEGSADIPFRFDANHGGARHAFIRVGNQVVNVTQAGR